MKETHKVTVANDFNERGNVVVITNLARGKKTICPGDDPEEFIFEKSEGGLELITITVEDRSDKFKMELGKNKKIQHKFLHLTNIFSLEIGKSTGPLSFGPDDNVSVGEDETDVGGGK